MTDTDCSDLIFFKWYIFDYTDENTTLFARYNFPNLNIVITLVYFKVTEINLTNHFFVK